MVKLDPNQCALVLLRALEERGERRGKPLTRARLSEASLKALWNRETITRDWLDQINEWLLSAGWILIEAGATYGAIRVTVVENWPRVASAHMQADLTRIRLNDFDFKQWNRLLDKEAWTDNRAAMSKPIAKKKSEKANAATSRKQSPSFSRQVE
jgi:hypothetical protein